MITISKSKLKAKMLETFRQLEASGESEDMAGAYFKCGWIA
jgi:hypothetical protein